MLCLVGHAVGVAPDLRCSFAEPGGLLAHGEFESRESCGTCESTRYETRVSQGHGETMCWARVCRSKLLSRRCVVAREQESLLR